MEKLTHSPGINRLKNSIFQFNCFPSFSACIVFFAFFSFPFPYTHTHTYIAYYYIFYICSSYDLNFLILLFRLIHYNWNSNIPEKFIRSQPTNQPFPPLKYDQIAVDAGDAKPYSALVWVIWIAKIYKSDNDSDGVHHDIQRRVETNERLCKKKRRKRELESRKKNVQKRKRKTITKRKKNPKHNLLSFACAARFLFCDLFCGIWHLLRAFALNNLLDFTLTRLLFVCIWKWNVSASASVSALKMSVKAKECMERNEETKESERMNLYLLGDKYAWNFSFCAHYTTYGTNDI